MSAAGATADRPSADQATADEATAAILADTLALARIPTPSGQEGGRITWLEQRLAAHAPLRRDDAGNLNWICLRVRVTVAGSGGHSWWDRGRASAAHELVRLLGWLFDNAPAGLSINVGIVQAGTAVNEIAAHAHALLEGRALDEQPLDELFRLIEEAAGRCSLPVTAQELDRRPAGRIDYGHPLAAAVLAERRAQLEGVLVRLLAGDREPMTATTVREHP